jgi:hypothetical protein
MDDFAPFESPKLLVDGAKVSIPGFEAGCNAFIQPHHGGDDLLYALSRIAGPNKHQRVISMSLNHTGLQLRTTSNAFIPHADLRPLVLNRWNELHNELEFMRAGPGMQGQNRLCVWLLL